MGNSKRTTKQSIKQRETMENELTTNKKNAFQRFASVFNYFKKKKQTVPIENEIAKAFRNSKNRDIAIEIIRHNTDSFLHAKHPYFNPIYKRKRTQSVTQRIHARPRKSAQIVKHKRVMRRKLIDVIQLDSRPDVDLVLNLINIHIDASFNEYQGDFNKLF